MFYRLTKYDIPEFKYLEKKIKKIILKPEIDLRKVLRAEKKFTSSGDITEDCFVRFNDHERRIKNNVCWNIVFSKPELEFSGNGSVEICCNVCEESFVNEFFLKVTLVLFENENNVLAKSKTLEDWKDAISLEHPFSILDLLEDELLLQSIKPHTDRKCNRKLLEAYGEHRNNENTSYSGRKPFLGLIEIMKK